MKDFLPEALLAKIDAQRTSRGFMSVTELLEKLSSEKNVVLDPFSVLVSRDVKIGNGNILYPNVIIETQNEGTISVGNNNVFFPGALLLANHGRIIIGDGNEFGDGGVSIKANMSKL
jgi:acetyltransferase-like isoleucine patch superfamily enzyme